VGNRLESAGHHFRLLVDGGWSLKCGAAL
jgi:hypothetical protein